MTVVVKRNPRVALRVTLLYEHAIEGRDGKDVSERGHALLSARARGIGEPERACDPRKSPASRRFLAAGEFLITRAELVPDGP